MTTQKRPLYLLIYPANSRSRLSAAHWSLFIPSLASLAALEDSVNNDNNNSNNKNNNNNNKSSNFNKAEQNKEAENKKNSSSSYHHHHSFPKRGKVIHVTGSPFTGFTHVVWRNYDITADRRNMAAPLKLCGLDLNLDGDGYIFDGDAKDGDDDGEIENTNENGDGTAAAAAAAASGTDEGKEEVENRHADAVRNTTVVIPKDILEREALKVPAPAVSRTPLIPGSENCQSWVWAYIRHLIDRGIIRDGEAVLEILGGATTT